MKVKIGKKYRVAQDHSILPEFRNVIVEVLGENQDFFFKEKYPINIKIIETGRKICCKEKHLKRIKNNIIKI